ncbi:UPF0280 family protein [Roseomonas arctica]|uniref:UPF0280 family protein n=2 Tax=Plastoroseomonas arctica TaxID=1509237 RepID=A0AAF1JWW4_9PROT|nr:UPF0280 family protein [Plastoroseomonas arctica]
MIHRVGDPVRTDHALAQRLPDGRLHLRNGPSDLIIAVDAPEAAREAAFCRAAVAFDGLIAALAVELPALRAPVGAQAFRHPVASRMAEAVRPHSAVFITPMAAVAGAIAEHVLTAIAADPAIRRAHVNNGGDIALHLAPGETLRVGLVRSLTQARPEGWVEITHAMPVRGIATSGWPGRSFSRGIADAVTVLAGRAPEADAAASIIANAVDAAHSGVRRAPAAALDPDSDLGETLVTTGVETLPAAVVEAALDAGLRVAEACCARGLIIAAVLFCQGSLRVASTVPGEIPGIPWLR